jgi:hypothetical protein
MVDEVFEVMTHVDQGLTNVSGFDPVDPVISINDANLKPGVSQLGVRETDSSSDLDKSGISKVFGIFVMSFQG